MIWIEPLTASYVVHGHLVWSGIPLVIKYVFLTNIPTIQLHGVGKLPSIPSDDEIIRPEPSSAPPFGAGVSPSELARRRLTSRGTPAVRQAVAQQRLKKTIEKASARTPSERDVQVTTSKRLAGFSNPSSPCCSLQCRAILPIESVRAELTRFLHLPEAQKTQYIANCITSARVLHSFSSV